MSGFAPTLEALLCNTEAVIMVSSIISAGLPPDSTLVICADASTNLSQGNQHYPAVHCLNKQNL